MSNDLQHHVQSIADTLSKGFGDEVNHEGEPMSAFDYLEDALDIEYIVNSKRQYLGARVLVAFGGPNIWVDTKRGIVEGSWWGESASVPFTDNIGLDEALQTLWEC